MSVLKVKAYTQFLTVYSILLFTFARFTLQLPCLSKNIQFLVSTTHVYNKRLLNIKGYNPTCNRPGDRLAKIFLPNKSLSMTRSSRGDR